MTPEIQKTKMLDIVLPDNSELEEFMLYYRQMTTLYETAIQIVNTHLDIISKECLSIGRHSPIRSVTNRIKNPQSIRNKLTAKGVPLTIRSILENLHDVAGVRVICEYISDIYAVKEALLSNRAIQLIESRDYIKTPKQNGYRSLHLIVRVQVPLYEGIQMITCEIQLRTTAMDSWAGLEHNLRYKKGRPYDADIDRKLRECAATLYETDLKMQEIADALGIFPSPKDD